jgi:lantibiotic modifying enzyme
VSDVATLITAIAGLVTSLTGLVGAIVVLVRVSKRERRKAAREVVAGLAEAAADGVITADELQKIAEEEGSL